VSDNEQIRARVEDDGIAVVALARPDKAERTLHAGAP
jgi:hypothetical protein